MRGYKEDQSKSKREIVVLIATGLYPPDIGGPATYTVFLERCLPSHGVKTLVVPFGTVRAYPKLLRHFLYLGKLLQRGKRAQVIYALDTVSVGVPALIASCILRKPFYLRVPGDYAWEQGQQRSRLTVTLNEYLKTTHRPLLVRVLAWIQYRVASAAKVIVVPSEYMKIVVTSWGIERTKIKRIYSALNPPETEAIEKDTGKKGAFSIITAGRLIPWKGMRAVIDAVTKLRAEGIPIKLTIAGSGPLGHELEAHVKDMDATDYIMLAGALEREDLARRITASDVFVLNTSYEGLSHQLLEVMWLKTVIVTTPVGGNRELIEDGKEGFFFPFNDIAALSAVLRSLYQDPSLRTTVANNARRSVEKFHEERIVPQIVDLFILA